MPVVSIDSDGVDVREQKDHLVATIGVKDFVIIQTKNLTLVAKKDHPDLAEGLLQIIEEIGNEEIIKNPSTK